ncbi:hypothetical protein N9043_01150 [bacterium]|nr:hypothetical protein [bacterium]
MPNKLYNFRGWIKVIGRGDDIDYGFPSGSAVVKELELHASLDNDMSFQVSIEKALTSMSDTATITLTNHPVLEDLYTRNRGLLNEWQERDLEVSIMLYHLFPHADQYRDKCNCIFTGNIVDIAVGESKETTDQSLTIKASAGSNAALRATVNKFYTGSFTYRDVMFDLLSLYEPFGFNIPRVDDPDSKLSKFLKRGRRYDQKVSDALNDIAKDLDMVWGFDSNPWTYKEMSEVGEYPDTPTDTNAIFRNKNCYFMDKRSTIDITGLHADTGTEPPINGVNGLRVSGETSHIGLIGHSKTQFTFNTITEPPYNIGMPVYADDAIAHLVVQEDRAIGRINRIMINNNVTRCECSYIDENTGLAILAVDGKNTGALLL